ncbi:unnamed protein product [Symbiodinium sp. KB8]|nr:unnamed protein product [Symbiodinium sp. KB8]
MVVLELFVMVVLSYLCVGVSLEMVFYLVTKFAKRVVWPRLCLLSELMVMDVTFANIWVLLVMVMHLVAIVMLLVCLVLIPVRVMFCCALSFQALCGLIVHPVQDDLWEMFRGFMFGCSAVFAFLAQDALSPGSAGAAQEVTKDRGYALYAQSKDAPGFEKARPSHLFTGVITIGIMAYRISEIELDHMFDGIGLVWVMLKVVVAGLGSVLAELLLKQAVSYMVGWEDLNPLDAAGQLKIAGGIATRLEVVIVGSFAYVLGRSQNDRFKQLEAKAGTTL